MSRRSRFRMSVIAVLILSAGIGQPSQSKAQEDSYKLTNLVKTSFDPGYQAFFAGVTELLDNGTGVGYTVESETRFNPFYLVDGKVSRIKVGEFGATFDGINSSGTIVGTLMLAGGTSGPPIGQAATWSIDNHEPVLLDLPSGPNGEVATSSGAAVINDAGVIGGSITVSTAESIAVYPVRWDNGVPTLLQGGTFEAFLCNVHAITPLGRIGGTCWNQDVGGPVSVTWDGVTPWIDEIPSGYGAAESSDLADNPDGVSWTVTGTVFDKGQMATEFVPIIWSAGEYTLLEPPVDRPYCHIRNSALVDDVLIVVGGCRENLESSSVADFRAVMWIDGIASYPDESVADLDSFEFRFCTDINNLGQIAGVGERKGVARAFLLTPVDQS